MSGTFTYCLAFVNRQVPRRKRQQIFISRRCGCCSQVCFLSSNPQHQQPTTSPACLHCAVLNVHSRGSSVLTLSLFVRACFHRAAICSDVGEHWLEADWIQAALIAVINGSMWDDAALQTRRFNKESPQWGTTTATWGLYRDREMNGDWLNDNMRTLNVN